MSLLDATLEAIRRERPEANRRGLELIGVVGSVARGDHGPESDVDTAYDVVGRASLLDVAHALNVLQDALGRRIVHAIARVRLPELAAAAAGLLKEPPPP